MKLFLYPIEQSYFVASLHSNWWFPILALPELIWRSSAISFSVSITSSLIERWLSTITASETHGKNWLFKSGNWNSNGLILQWTVTRPKCNFEVFSLIGSFEFSEYYLACLGLETVFWAAISQQAQRTVLNWNIFLQTTGRLNVESFNNLHFLRCLSKFLRQNFSWLDHFLRI